MKKLKDLYELKLHETRVLAKAVSVTRVPGGWLYYMYQFQGSAMQFVPYNTEFKEELDLNEKSHRCCEKTNTYNSIFDHSSDKWRW